MPWYVTPGNHDYMGDIQAQLDYGAANPAWILPATYYSRDFAIEGVNTLRILFLDTNPFMPEYRTRPHRYRRIEEQDTGEQLQWMRKTLSEAGVRWRIAVGHHPVYSTGHHGDSRRLEDILPQLFSAYRVQAYFAGHDHHLEHFRPAGGTSYFVSGGGSSVREASRRPDSLFTAASLGFAHVSVDRRCMTVRFINAAGTVLHRTRLSVDDVSRCRDGDTPPAAGQG